MTLGRRHNPGVFQDGAEESRNIMIMFGVSALLHGIVFLILVSMPGFGSSRSLAGRSITVSLVSLPGPGGGSPSPPAPAPEAAPAPEPPPKVDPAPEPPAQEPVSIPEPQPEAVSIASKKAPPPELKSMKKKTKTDKKIKVKKAPTQKIAPTQKAPTRSKSVTSAIAALKNRVAEEESDQGTGAGGETGVGGGPGGIRRIDMYRIEVALAVERNWAFSEHLAGGGTTLETLIVFRVRPNGEVTDFEFVKKSGNRYLDESAYKAVMKSNPVTPHPDGIRKAYVEVPLRFTPTGIR